MCAVATSQSVVNNSQTESGDIAASGTLNVVTVTDSATATTPAVGNNLSGAAVVGSLDVESTQGLTGNVSSVTHGHFTVGVGNATVMTTASTGSEVVADNLGGTALTGNLSQTTGNVAITSETDFNGGNATFGSVSASSQAISNAITLGLSNDGSFSTTSNVTTNQSSSAFVDAETGSEPHSGAALAGSTGTVQFSTIAVSNNLSGSGAGATSQTLDATQTATGNLTQAAGFVNTGTVQTVQGDATVTANNISTTNQGGTLDVADTQTNSSFVYGQSVVTSFEFGTGEATADGVGNSVMAGNFGPTTDLNNTQVNTGGTEAIASFTGTGGTPSYDASASATAMGNAATGFACSACGGTINVNNNQTNSGGVDSFATAQLDGSARSVNVVSTAVGNNATFYVSKPSN